jgi:transcriptional regulator with XRE-family HTH domain
MVRVPLTPEQLEAGRRLGAAIRSARGERSQGEVAVLAGISPETLRKIETGRLPSPAFGVVVGIAQALDMSLDELAVTWGAAGGSSRRSA